MGGRSSTLTATRRAIPGVLEAGGLPRDSNKAFKGAFTFTCGSCSAITAELWAIYHGLQLASKLGITKLLLKTDSKIAQGYLTKTHDQVYANQNLVKNCRKLISAPTWEVVVRYVGRKMNQAADALAKWSFTQSEDFVEYGFAPDCIRGFINILPML